MFLFLLSHGQGIDFDEDQISVISLEDEEDLFASISTTGSLGAADPPPDGFRKDQLKARIMDVVTRMKSGKIRRKALQDLSALLQKIQEYPSVALPASSLGQLVAISCLSALDPDPECRQRAAEALCHLLPILRRKEETLARTSWNQTLLIRARKVLQSTGGAVPELFLNNCYSLARVSRCHTRHSGLSSHMFWVPQRQQLGFLLPSPDLWASLTFLSCFRSLVPIFLRSSSWRPCASWPAIWLSRAASTPWTSPTCCKSSSSSLAAQKWRWRCCWRPSIRSPRGLQCRAETWPPLLCPSCHTNTWRKWLHTSSSFPSGMEPSWQVLLG
nr:uncharacterized protein LOC118094539 [Zootoca vivipara]